MATDATLETEAAPEVPAFDLLGLEKPSFAAIQSARTAVLHDPRSRQAFERQVNALPNVGEEGRRRGLGLWILGRHEEAIDQLARYENDDVADYTRARSLMSLKRPQAALPIFERLTKAYPGEPRPRGSMLEAQLDSQLFASGEDGAADLTDPTVDTTAAVDALGRALGQAPKDFLESADGHYLRARQAELQRDLEEAMEHYLAAYRLDPTMRNNLVRGAYLAERCGLDQQALEMYETALEMRLLDRAQMFNLGVLYEDLGRDHDAAALYDVLIRLDPTDERARRYLSDAVSAMDMYYDEDMERKEDKLNQILRIPITDFELSVRARNCLNKMQIHTLGDLVTKTEQELLSYKNFGETSLNEIKEILRSKGLRLGMPREEAVASIEARARRSGSTPAVEGGDTLDRPITELQLSIRARRTVEALGCLTVGDIIKHSADELLGMPNFGSTSLQELRSKLADLGFKLAGE
jgi:DNA-directed RNA polymerase subunit alpha